MVIRTKIFMCALFMTLTAFPMVQAATLHVNTNFDNDMASQFDCTLRNALKAVDSQNNIAGCINSGVNYGIQDTIIINTGFPFPLQLQDTLIIYNFPVKIIGNGAVILADNNINQCSPATPWCVPDDTVFNHFSIIGQLAQVEIIDLELRSGAAQGKSTLMGGGSMQVLDHASVTLKNVTFISNWTSYGPGGAIAVYDSNLVINDSYLQNNKSLGFVEQIDADSVVSHGGDGGAISAISSLLEINNTDFLDNKATTSGGAISAINSVLEINDSNFLNNTGEGTGGALALAYNWAKDGESHTVIRGSHFSGNTASFPGIGGAIYQTNISALVNNSSDMRISNSVFEENIGAFTLFLTLPTFIQESSITNNLNDLGASDAAFDADNDHIPDPSSGIYNESALFLRNTTIGGNISFSEGADPGFINASTGAIYNSKEGVSFLTHVTINDNIGKVAIRNHGKIYTIGSLLGHKDFVCSNTGSILSGNDNIESDNSCGLSGNHDAVNQALMLSPLQPSPNLLYPSLHMPVYKPLSGSPALDYRPDCTDFSLPFPAHVLVDERNKTRGKLCDAGAFEVVIGADIDLKF